MVDDGDAMAAASPDTAGATMPSRPAQRRGEVNLSDDFKLHSQGFPLTIS